jgi:hypothetical protein
MREGKNMKKRCVGVCAGILLLAAFTAGPAVAAVDFDLGIKAGVSIATYKWTDGETSCSLKKPVIGVFAAFNLTRCFAIQPEIYYLMLGGVDETEYDDAVYKYVNYDNYLHIPVLAKYRFMPGKKLSPVLFAGPAVSFLLSAHYKFFIDDVEQYDKPITQYLKKTRFSVFFGGGLEYQMDKLKLLLDIRYDLGLTNIDAENDPEDQLKSRALMLMVGVGF